MEIVTIEAKTFEAMLAGLENFTERIEHLSHVHGEKDLSDWLDNQDACLLLDMTPRSLQTLRDNGILAYSRINQKIYYKSSDIQELLYTIKEKRENTTPNRKKI